MAKVDISSVESYGTVDTSHVTHDSHIPEEPPKKSYRTILGAVALGCASIGAAIYSVRSGNEESAVISLAGVGSTKHTAHKIAGSNPFSDLNGKNLSDGVGKGHPTWLGTVDAKATDETIALAESLAYLGKKSYFLFGHQNSNYLGQYFKDKDGTEGHSDVYNGTGSYPAVFGYDWLDVIENGIDFTEHVKYAYSQGGVIAFDWKPYNPEMMGSSGANDVAGTPCKKILEMSGKTYDRWIEWLDTIADSIKDFKYNGVKIPIIFRLLHENTGGWYWWGTKTVDGTATCSDSEYKGLFNFTQYYLNEEKSIHQILWLYAPAKPSYYYDLAFVDRYPGHDRVDLIGFDRYADESDYKSEVLDDCRTVGAFAAAHGKISCIGETGISDGIQDLDDKDWYYDDFAKLFMTDSKDECTKISYAMAWENANQNTYWVPLPQDEPWTGFQKLYESDYAVFADDKSWQTELKKNGYY